MPPEQPERGDPVDLLDAGGAGGTSIRGGAIRVAGYFGGLFLLLVSTPLLIRHLGLAEFGRYSAALAIVTLAGGVTEFGLRDAAVREYTTSSPDAQDDLMASAIGVRIALSVLGVVFAAGFALAAGYDQALVLGVLVASVGMLFTALQPLLAVPLAVQLRQTTLTALDLLTSVVNVSLTVILVVAGLGTAAFLDMQLVIPLPAMVLTAWLVRRTVPLRPRFHAAQWRRVLIAILPFTVISVVGVFYSRISIIVISLVSTKLQTGYFATSFRVVTALVFVGMTLTSAAFPILSRVARDDAARFAYAATRGFQAMLVAGAALATALAVGAPFVARVLANHDHGPIVTTLRIHVLVLPSAFVIALDAYALLAAHRPRAVLVSAAVGLLVNALLLALLVPSHGAIGGAIAGSTGEAVIAVLETVALFRAIGAAPPVRTVLAVAAASGTGVLITVLTGLPALPAAVIATLAFAAVILATRVLPRELFDAFVRR